jgi:hypothetical protein
MDFHFYAEEPRAPLGRQRGESQRDPERPDPRADG